MFTIGADPEVFLKKGRSFISAETKKGALIPGTKKNPFEVKGGAIQVDGVAAEFNVNASKNFDEFYGNIKTVLLGLKERVKQHDEKIVLMPVPTATFPQKYFDDLPKHTKELGCEPDFSAYTLKANPRPVTNEPFRTGSGHIHIGWTNGKDPFNEGHMLDCQLVAKELDKYLHYASLAWDDDKKRQKLYGAPGSFRPKSYGIEYRPLSNAWLRKPELIKHVYTITMGVMKALDSGKLNLNKSPQASYGNTPIEKVYTSLGGHIYDIR